MGRKSSNFYKRVSLFVLVVVSMLCVAMVLHAEHIGTLFNTRAITQSFENIINQDTGVKKDARAEDFELPTDWWMSNTAADFDGGDGTVENPYLISTPEQLALMANKINNQGGSYITASYQLTADVDMSKHFWSPIGRWEDGRAFKGTFDGASHDVGVDGVDYGTVHTIDGLVMKNHGDFSSGTIVGFFGLLGDQAVVQNIIFDNAIAYLDPEIETSERATLAIVVSQVLNDATVLLQNMAVLNSATFTPQTLSPDGSDGLDFIGGEIKSGIFVAWQQGVDEWGDSAKGVIYMNEVHARMSSIMINIYLDLSGWDMSPDIVVNSFGGIIGEARQVDIENSSYEGIIGVEVVRKDRNMDNAQFIFNAGGLVGTMDAYNSSESYFENIDLSGSIYLDTFKNEDDGFSRNVASSQSLSTRANNNSNFNSNNNSNNNSNSTNSNNNSRQYQSPSKDNRDMGAIPWSSDVRQIGTVIGDANIWGLGSLDINNVNASFFIDAPKGNKVQLGDDDKTDLGGIPTRSIDSSTQSIDTQSVDTSTQGIDKYSKNSRYQSMLNGDIDPALKAKFDDLKTEAEASPTHVGTHAFLPHLKASRFSSGNTGLEGPPPPPAGSVVFATASPFLVIGLSWGAIYLIDMAIVATIYGVGLLATIVIVVAVVIIILAIVVFAVLFSIWGGQKPKWESVVSVGGAIGSLGRSGIKLTNVHTANQVIASDTMFSRDDKEAEIVDSHNTTPTLGMLTSQPESQKSSQSIGDKVHLEVSGKGTIMSNGSKGADSVLEYQWYYNTIDSNNILDGTEHGLGGAKTVKVEGATDSTLDLNIDWVGSRYYFVKQVNHVLEFRGNINSVTARVGNRKTSLKPAEIIQQPEDIDIIAGVADAKLNVQAIASGDIDYQWYQNTEPSVEGAILLPGVDKSEFVPYQEHAGTYYYYAMVIVSLPISGTDEVLRSETISRFAKVDVQNIANDISILVQPEAEKTVELNRTTTLGVSVDLNNINGAVGYQWFKASKVNSDGQAIDGEIINGETNQSLVVDTSVPNSTSYYYVIASNTVGNDIKYVRSDTSKISVSTDVALKIKMEYPPESVTGIAGQTLSIFVFATAEDGGVLKYQWFKSESTSNIGGKLLEGENEAKLSITAGASLGYYYVELYAITPNGYVSKQATRTVSIEWKDANQYKFDQLNESLKDTRITSPSYSTNNLYDLQNSKSTSVDLQVSLDIDRSMNVSYQWYKSDKVDGSDAVAIPGAVGSAWRIYKDSDIGTKYYFVKVVHSTQVYNKLLSQQANTTVYTTVINYTDLAPVAVQHPDASSTTSDMTSAIVVVAVAIVILSLVSGAIILEKKKRAKLRLKMLRVQQQRRMQ